MTVYSTIKKISFAGITGLFLATLITPMLNVKAQEVTGNGLLISPTRTELTANAGETKDFSISVKNVTKADLTAKAYLNDFESDGTSGNPKIITDTSKRTPYTLDGMIKGLTDLDLKAGESKTVNLSLKLKDKMSPGAYFGVVRYAAVNKANNNGQDQVSLTASIGHLVFLTVPGSVEEKIQLQDLKVTNEKNQTGILFNKPSKASVSVKNLGNGFSRPFGKISIYSGSKEVSSIDVNSGETKGIVLPNSSRTFDGNVKGVSRPGKYKVSASVAYGNGGEVVTLTKSFWYLPIWFVVVLIAILGLIIGGAYYLYRRVSVGRSKK